MRARAAYLHRGIGQFILDEIIRTARGRSHRHLYLETGTGAAFKASHALYLKNGFMWREAFGNYTATEFNVFMVKKL